MSDKKVLATVEGRDHGGSHRSNACRLGPQRVPNSIRRRKKNPA